MITYRRGLPDDAPVLFEIFEAAIDDLGARMQANGNSTAGDVATLARLAEIDRALLGYRRDVDHQWFAHQRRGRIYRRGADIVAYGYAPVVAGWGGPYAALVADDLPRLLADAESDAHRAGHAEISFDVTLTNRAALDHLLGRGYRVQPFPMILFSDTELGRLDQYVFCSPAFIA